jgi:tripartite-type tricarboxylate transporter receptor subunit TctC
MTMNRRDFLGATIGLSSAAMIGPVRAQDTGWRPTRIMRFVVPFAAGATADTLSRMMADAVSTRLGQTVVVENRPGAGGSIGTDVLAKAEPDGHTLGLVTVGTGAINYSIYRNLTYTPKDLVAISNFCSVPNVIMVADRIPAKTLGELVELVRKSPGEYNFGSSGVGTSLHLTGEMVKNGNGLKMTHVPFRGAAQMLMEGVAGRVEIIIDNLPSGLPFIVDGRLRALAVTDTQRSPALKDVPTTTEAGFPDVQAVAWFGAVAPAKTPQPAIDALSAALQAATREPSIREKLAQLGAEPVGNTPAQFEAFIGKEITKWGDVVRKANVKID